MIRYYAIYALGAFFVFCIAILIGSGFSEKSRRRKIQSAFEEEYDADPTDHAPEIKEMVMLYLTMAAKHGPDSEEAKAFRFGTGSSLMKRLHGDDVARKAFSEQADVIDEVCKRMMKRKKR
jgi:excinuclease UvrABC helicase subunit UvrB